MTSRPRRTLHVAARAALTAWIGGCAGAASAPRPSVEARASACADARARVGSFVTAGRTESALAEIRRLDRAPCGPLDDALKRRRDELRAELGDPVGDEAPPDVAGSLDTPARLHELVAEGSRIAAEKDEAGAERVFARARRMLERIAGTSLAFDGFRTFGAVGIGDDFALLTAERVRGGRGLLVANLSPGGAAEEGGLEPTRWLADVSSVVVGPVERTFVVEGSRSEWFESPDAPPVALAANTDAFYAPSGATLVTIGDRVGELRDGRSGALRHRFDLFLEGGAREMKHRFFRDESLFVATYPPLYSGGGVVMLDLQSGSVIASEVGFASAMSTSGRFVALASHPPGSPMLLGTVWDTHAPEQSPWTVELAPVDYLNGGGVVAFDESESKLVYGTRSMAGAMPNPDPITASAFDLPTRTAVKKPESSAVSWTPLDEWNLTTAELRLPATERAMLLPALDSPDVHLRTLSWSTDRKTLALVAGRFQDMLVWDPVVLLVDASTHAITQRVSLGTEGALSVVNIRFGPGDWLAFDTSEGVSGFIDRRTGEVQRGPTEDPDWLVWNRDGRLAGTSRAIRDLGAKREHRFVDADAALCLAWLERPDARLAPRGIVCMAGEWVVPAAVCWDRLKLPK